MECPLSGEDIVAAHDQLVNVFGFAGDGIERTADGTLLHSEVCLGESRSYTEGLARGAAPDYLFVGPRGEVSFDDLFEGSHQLLVYHSCSRRDGTPAVHTALGRCRDQNITGNQRIGGLLEVRGMEDR